LEKAPGLPDGTLSGPSAPDLSRNSLPPDGRAEDPPGEIQPPGGFGPHRGHPFARIGAGVDKGDDARAGPGKAGTQGSGFQGRPDQGAKLGNQPLAGGLVEAVLGRHPQKVEPVRQQGHRPQGRPAQVKDRIGQGHRPGQDPPGFFGGEVPVRNEEDNPKVAGNRQADGLGQAFGLEDQGDPAQDGRGGVVRVAFYGGGQPEKVQDLEPAAGN